MSEVNEESKARARPPKAGGRDAPFEDEREPVERVLTGLSLIGLALRSQAWERAAVHGLNPTQARVVALLARTDEEGATLAYLAKYLGVSGPTASDSVSTLEKKGLVEKRASPADRRALAIRLTAAGREAAGLVAQWPAAVVAAIEELGAGERVALLETLVTLVRGLQARGLIAPARTCVSCRFFQAHADRGSDRPHYCRFAQAYFHGENLRLDCLDHRPAPAELAEENWSAFRATARSSP